MPPPMRNTGDKPVVVPPISIGVVKLLTGLLVPPPPTIAIVPSMTLSVVPASVLVGLSRTNLPAPPFFWSTMFVSVAVPAVGPVERAPGAKSAFPLTVMIFGAASDVPEWFASTVESERSDPPGVLPLAVSVTAFPACAKLMLFSVMWARVILFGVDTVLALTLTAGLAAVG